MKKELVTKTKTNAELLNEILSNYKPKTNWINKDSNVKGNTDVGGIEKFASPNNILQNLSWQLADMKGMNVQNQSTVSPFTFLLNFNQNRIFAPQNTINQRNYKISRQQGE